MTVAEMPGWLLYAKEASLPTFAIAAMLAVIVAAIKVWPTVQQQQIESDASLRADLLKRVTDLEKEVQALRKALDQARVTHAAEMMDLLHDLGNESQRLDTLLMLAETSLESLPAHLPEIRKQRDDHRKRMTTKRAEREAALVRMVEIATP